MARATRLSSKRSSSGARRAPSAFLVGTEFDLTVVVDLTLPIGHGAEVKTLQLQGVRPGELHASLLRPFPQARYNTLPPRFGGLMGETDLLFDESSDAPNIPEVDPLTAPHMIDCAP